MSRELPAMGIHIRDILENVVDITDDLAIASPELLAAVIEALESVNSALDSVSNMVVGVSDGVSNVANNLVSRFSFGGWGGSGVFPKVSSVVSSFFAGKASERKNKSTFGPGRKHRR